MSTTSPVTRPEAGEYAPYYEKYIALTRDADVIEILERQASETVALLRGLTEEQGASRYEPGKWSVKELVGHITDAERVFAYRALRFARGDRTALPGFDQDPYVAAGNFDARSLKDLVEEYEHVRRATIALLRPLGGDDWRRKGTASDHDISVRALAHIIAGHELHHVNVLKTKYLSGEGA